MRAALTTQPVASRRDDHGSAMLVTVMVMAVITGLAATLLAVTVNNLGSARRSQESAGALDAADAGVTQATIYLRENGARGITCSPTCAANPWGNSTTPQLVNLPGATDQSYRVWIEPRPATQPTYYRVHSEGRDRDGVRLLQVDVELALLNLPVGVFARSVQGGGNASVSRQSIYTTGCVWNRRNIKNEGIDAATGLPAAVHSSKVITNSNGNTGNCAPGGGAIHQGADVCNESDGGRYLFDHDSLGGTAAGSACDQAQRALGVEKFNRYYAPRDLDGDGAADVAGTFLRDDAALEELFGVDDSEPLSQPELDHLREVARSQGTYFTKLSEQTDPDPVAHPHSVMFFDLADGPDAGGVVDLNDIDGYSRAKDLSASAAACEPRSLVIIIDGGNAKLNSNQQLYANLILTSTAPNGEVIKANGTADFIGTIFADKVNLVGTVNLSLDDCFVKNMAPSLYDVSISNYLEVDR